MTLPHFIAAALGPAVAGVVWRAGLLTGDGAIAAAAMGSAAAIAGPDWMALLLAFFISSVLLGRLGQATKLARSRAILDKAGPRDAAQVLANGLVFGVGAALASSGHLTTIVSAAALGALAAATADTWGTEIGMLARSAPRSILTWTTLEAGMSGGVSMQGLAATAAGAASIATLAWLLGWSGATAIAAAIGGIGGAIADSVLGATLQQRRRSLSTGRMTERLTDDDGAATEAIGGLTWLNNDGVNLVATITGSLIAIQVQALLAMRGAA